MPASLSMKTEEKFSYGKPEFIYGTVTANLVEEKGMIRVLWDAEEEEEGGRAEVLESVPAHLEWADVELEGEPGYRMIRGSTRREGKLEYTEVNPATGRDYAGTVDTVYLNQHRDDKMEVGDGDSDMLNLYEGITISLSTRLLGASIGVCKGKGSGRDDYLTKKKKEILGNLQSLRKLRNFHSEILLLKFCGTAQAQFLTGVMPALGNDDVAHQQFISELDSTVNGEWCRLLGISAEQLQSQLRGQISLPGSMGGLGCPTIKHTAPSVYVTSAMTSFRTMKTHAADLADHLKKSLSSGEDQFAFVHNYIQLQNMHSWFDGSEKKGTAVVRIEADMEKALTKGALTANRLARNLHTRVRRTLMWNWRCIAEDRKLTPWLKQKARDDIARLESASGKVASKWLDCPPRAARTEVTIPKPAPHIFEIMIRLRLGMELPNHQNMKGGKCRCQCKKNTWDVYGNHLTACPWGGWRTKRHDDVLRVLLEWARAVGNMADEKVVGQIPPRFECIKNEEGEVTSVLAGIHVYPDGVITNREGARLAIDVGVTARRLMKAQKAADVYEDAKNSKYNKHRHLIEEQGGFYPNLEVIPLIFESHGRLGKQARIFVKGLSRQYGEEVLPTRDESALSVHTSAWQSKLSMTLQMGTAEMIFNITRGSRSYHSTPARAQKQAHRNSVEADNWGASKEHAHCPTCSCADMLHGRDCQVQQQSSAQGKGKGKDKGKSKKDRVTKRAWGDPEWNRLMNELCNTQHAHLRNDKFIGLFYLINTYLLTYAR